MVSYSDKLIYHFLESHTFCQEERNSKFHRLGSSLSSNFRNSSYGFPVIIFKVIFKVFKKCSIKSDLRKNMATLQYGNNVNKNA